MSGVHGGVPRGFSSSEDGAEFCVCAERLLRVLREESVLSIRPANSSSSIGMRVSTFRLKYM